MASYQKVNNKWSVRFDIRTLENKRKQIRLSGYRTRNEAERAYISYIAEDKNVKPQSDKSFLKAYEAYMKYKQLSIKESSQITCETDFRLHILPFFKDIDINSIKNTDIIDWQDYLKNKDLNAESKTTKPIKLMASKSMNRIYGFLINFFKYCYDFNLIKEIPIKGVKQFKKTSKKSEMLIWTEKDYLSFLEKVEEIEYNALFSTLYLTGVRIGEALALNWNCLNGNELTVKASLTKKTKEKIGNANLKKTTTKNDKDRIVLIPNILLNKLNNLKNHYRSLENFNENNFMFGNLVPLSHETIKRKKDKACEDSKVTRITLHDFRHSHVSYLISKGFDIVTIANRVGHRDIKMTLNTYAHLMPNKQKELLKSLEIGV